MDFITQYASPVGMLTIAGSEEGLAGLWIHNQKYFAAGISSEILRKDDLPIFEKTREWLDRYFSGGRPTPGELSLSPRGSLFQQAVWTLLCDIPWGETITYGALASRVAERLGKSSMSARAVGSAVGRNPISIIIPCHRVIGANGRLTGYAGGLSVKKRLLELENVKLPDRSIPG